MELKAHPLSVEIISDIAKDLGLKDNQVSSVIKLTQEKCTVPFIARYRKEATGELDEVKIRDILEQFEYVTTLNERKEAILRSITEQQKLTPELRAKILSTKIKADLEDLYLPFKPKKRTRGQIAAERGLVPLAEEILQQQTSLQDLDTLFASYVGKHADLKNSADVMQGVKDYLAEIISEKAEVRKELRQWIFENATVVSEVREEHKDKKTKYNNYYAWTEPLKSIASHRLMALRRGEKEDILKVTFQFDETVALAIIASYVIKQDASESAKNFLTQCVEDSYQRLLNPSIETELRLETKAKAEVEAISVFGKNLRNLLLLPPIPKRIVLGIDPGLRTGSKLAVVDRTGKLLEHATIYPVHRDDEKARPLRPGQISAEETLVSFIKNHGVEFIAIGNGTAGREMETFVEKTLAQNKDIKVKVIIVNEAGASVYSASDLAREELPNLDITYRGAVSIARRLQDPLAELVKIDPKSIGVGQYQHDVNQSKLKKQLGDIVESCVNYVGVNLNTASPSLLSYVAGIGPSLAKNIVRYRGEHGEFQSRQKLLDVAGFGQKAFEQAAGFLRIRDGENPLDNTAVHPESYSLIEKMAQQLSISLKDMIGSKENVEKIKLEDFVNDEIGLPTLQDIIKELLKPGRDPRESGARQSYNREVKNFDHLKEGQIITGTVTNVTNFGAFVDIGVHQDGLIHISELANEFVKDLSKVISVGQEVKVKVVGVDRERKRISLSKRACEEGGARPAPGQSKETRTQQRPSAQTRSAQTRPAQAKAPEKKPEEKHASIEDLLNKFNAYRSL